VITRDGCVTALQIVRGFIPSFNRAALLAASQWQFSPALMDGVPVAVGYQITINFKVK
jgi:TonB family protein